MAKFCFHCFVHFDGIPIYISSFHHKQCACDKKDFTVMKFSSQFCNSPDESLKDKTHLLYKYIYNGMNTTLVQYSEFILVVTQQS